MAGLNSKNAIIFHMVMQFEARRAWGVFIACNSRIGAKYRHLCLAAGRGETNLWYGLLKCMQAIGNIFKARSMPTAKYSNFCAVTVYELK